MKKVLLILVLTLVGLNLMSCIEIDGQHQQGNKAPIDMSEYVSADMVDDFKIRLDINMDGIRAKYPSVFRYEHRVLSDEMIAVIFYDINSNAIGFANVKFRTEKLV